MNQALLAFVKTNALISEHQIENILKTKLTSYMIPQVIFVENIPLLVNGKIDRQALLKTYENTNNNGKIYFIVYFVLENCSFLDDDTVEIDIDFSGVKNEQMKDAKILFEIVASVLNRTTRSTISLTANFYEIGGNSLNSIYTITKLNENGYYISIGDFLAAADLGEVLERMTSAPKIETKPVLFSAELLKNEHKTDVIE